MDFYIIHLKRAEKRRENVEYLQQTLPGKTRIIDAVDAEKLTKEEVDACYKRKIHFPPYPFRLTQGEIACFLSHRKAWKMIAEGNAAFGCVLEDDVEFDMVQLQTAKHMVLYQCDETDFIRLPVRLKEKPDITITTQEDQSLFLPVRCGLGTVAQIIGRKAAQHLLKVTDPFDRPVDTTLQMTWITGQKMHVVQPSGIREISNETGGSIINRKKKISQRLNREALRPAYKLAIYLLASMKKTTA